MAELAEVISVATGRTVTYTDLPPSSIRQSWSWRASAEDVAAMVVDGDRGVAAGELLVEGDDLKRLWAGRRRRWLTPATAAVANPARLTDLAGTRVTSTAAGGSRPGVGPPSAASGWRRSPAIGPPLPHPQAS